VTRISIKGKSASQVFDWLCSLNQERYLQWHPAHKDYRLSKGPKGFVGNIIYFDEQIDGFRINWEWKVVDLRENELILMKARYFYPICLSLSLKEIRGNTEVAHELRVGFAFKGFEKPFDWLVSRLIFTDKRAKALNQHAIEEFKNLERLIT